MRYFDAEYWKCRDHPTPDAEEYYHTYYGNASAMEWEYSSNIREFCRSAIEDGIRPEGIENPSEQDVIDWMTSVRWEQFHSMYPSVELSDDEKKYLVMGYLPKRVREQVDEENRRCLEFAAEREAEYAGLLEKFKAVDPELYYHFIGDDYRDLLATLKVKGGDVIIDMPKATSGQLKRIVFKDAQIDEGVPPEEFYIELVEWYVEGDGRSAYIDVVVPGRDRSWFSVVFRSARFVGADGKDVPIVVNPE